MPSVNIATYFHAWKMADTANSFKCNNALILSLRWQFKKGFRHPQCRTYAYFSLVENGARKKTGGLGPLLGAWVRCLDVEPYLHVSAAITTVATWRSVSQENRTPMPTICWHNSIKVIYLNKILEIMAIDFFIESVPASVSRSDRQTDGHTDKRTRRRSQTAL